MKEPTGIEPAAWHAVSAQRAADALDVDPGVGLSSAQVADRLQRYGPNRLAEVPREPRWRAFVRQFRDLLIVILLVAPVVSAVVSREWATPLAIAVVVLLSATIGFVQESSAEASLDALRRMLVTTATVRRDGRITHASTSATRGSAFLRPAGRMTKLFVAVAKTDTVSGAEVLTRSATGLPDADAARRRGAGGLNAR